MKDRSLGVTALAFGSVMVGLYCQFAAIALILTGSVFAVAGSTPAAMALLLGAVFLGLTFAAYFVGYGFWARKHWSWAGGIALFGVLVGASLVLSFISTSFISSVSPIIASAVVVWFLNRPAIKAELLGPSEAARTQTAVPDTMDAAEPAH